MFSFLISLFQNLYQIQKKLRWQMDNLIGFSLLLVSYKLHISSSVKHLLCPGLRVTSSDSELCHIVWASPGTSVRRWVTAVYRGGE